MIADDVEFDTVRCTIVLPKPLGNAIQPVGKEPRWAPEPRRYKGQRQKKPRGAWKRRRRYLYQMTQWRARQSDWWAFDHGFTTTHPIGPPAVHTVTVSELYEFAKGAWDTVYDPYPIQSADSVMPCTGSEK